MTGAVDARSPAVASVAICIAPENADSRIISGITARSRAPRCCELETSITWTTTAVATAGLTPRPISRRLPISLL